MNRIRHLHPIRRPASAQRLSRADTQAPGRARATQATRPGAAIQRNNHFAPSAKIRSIISAPEITTGRSSWR
jgi:hypothetical protein